MLVNDNSAFSTSILVISQVNMGNAFNLMLQGVMFQEIFFAQGDINQCIHYFHTFYALEYPLYFNTIIQKVRSLPST